MRKIIIAMLVFVPTLLLSGCYVSSYPNSYYYTSSGYYPTWKRYYTNNYGWGGTYRNAWYRNGGWGHRHWGHHGGWGYHNAGGHWRHH